MSYTLNIQDAAKLLNVSIQDVEALLKKGIIHGKYMGAGWRINAESVIAYKRQLDAQTDERP